MHFVSQECYCTHSILSNYQRNIVPEVERYSHDG